ncbi:MAG: hypothetical protein LBL47_02270 [Lactobacillus sp.]|jgi:hypothetical protein|nr:hypothetical protein [Lactobacillus sp.]
MARDKYKEEMEKDVDDYLEKGADGSVVSDVRNDKKPGDETFIPLLRAKEKQQESLAAEVANIISEIQQGINKFKLNVESKETGKVEEDVCISRLELAKLEISEDIEAIKDKIAAGGRENHFPKVSNIIKTPAGSGGGYDEEQLEEEKPMTLYDAYKEASEIKKNPESAEEGAVKKQKMPAKDYKYQSEEYEIAVNKFQKNSKVDKKAPAATVVIKKPKINANTQATPVSVVKEQTIAKKQVMPKSAAKEAVAPAQKQAEKKKSFWQRWISSSQEKRAKKAAAAQVRKEEHIKRKQRELMLRKRYKKWLDIREKRLAAEKEQQKLINDKLDILSGVKQAPKTNQKPKPIEAKEGKRIEMKPRVSTRNSAESSAEKSEGKLGKKIKMKVDKNAKSKANKGEKPAGKKVQMNPAVMKARAGGRGAA